MTFSIITPAFKQTDWLRLCVLSVADQVVPEACGIVNSLLNIDDSEAGRAERFRQSAISNQQSAIASPLRVEHIIQDAGSSDIEAFAWEMASHLLQKYGGEEIQELAPCEILHLRVANGYTLRIFKEPDAGMYDAINRGVAKMSGDLWAWLNCDEQYLEGTLSYARAWFEAHTDSDILCGDAVLLDQDGRALSYRRAVPPQWHHTRLVHLSSLSCASFYRRKVVEIGGIFDTAWRSIGDAEWMARLIKKGLRIRTCHRLLASFTFTGENTSESPAAQIEAEAWRRAPDALPTWIKTPIILHHRLRKLLGGAYALRNFSYAIHGKNSAVRQVHSAGPIGWAWPSSERKEPSITSLDRAKSACLDGQLFNVIGTLVTASTYGELSKLLLGLVHESKVPIAVDFANTHIVTMRRHDPDFARLSECIDITVPDGMPLVWLMNGKGAGLEDRVYGPTFTREFLKNSPAGLKHYLVGGSEECGRRFRERMMALNPALEFIGGYHGKCSPEGHLEEDAAVLEEIRAMRPDFIWVGLGTPKQYGWINRIKPKLDHGVMLAVGFAFDVNAGMKSDAPAWMQRSGLTWLYRMASEPERLLGRYVKWNTLFLGYGMGDFLFGPPETMGRSRRDRLKLEIRKWGLVAVDLISSDIRDCMTGEKLGRGLVLGWGGHVYVIGYPSLPPLIPRFLPQKRLTYWRQVIGFTMPEAPDYGRLRDSGTTHSVGEGGEDHELPRSLPRSKRVMNLVLTHEAGARFNMLRERWKSVCADENLWVAFGGSREQFDLLDYPRKVFIDDSRLRRRDNQREKQCYAGIFRAMAEIVVQEAPDFIYLCEYDQLPLISDLNQRQVEELEAEGADVMGHWLYRINGTGHYHELYHEADPEFLPFWKSLSLREDSKLILSMFGSGSLWTREAFLAIARQVQSIECYLEIYLPTLAHHLGFRVRRWREDRHLISNLPSLSVTEDVALKRGCWTVHPVKELGEKLTLLKAK